jgi:hypothetical protein
MLIAKPSSIDGWGRTRLRGFRGKAWNRDPAGDAAERKELLNVQAAQTFRRAAAGELEQDDVGRRARTGQPTWRVALHALEEPEVAEVEAALSLGGATRSHLTEEAALAIAERHAAGRRRWACVGHVATAIAVASVDTTIHERCVCAAIEGEPSACPRQQVPFEAADRPEHEQAETVIRTKLQGHHLLLALCGGRIACDSRARHKLSVASLGVVAIRWSVTMVPWVERVQLCALRARWRVRALRSARLRAPAKSITSPARTASRARSLA